jgi:hypothetical protein
MDNIKEKIQKLLALATSPNENEAKAALLKAKEMMAKHKMTEADFEQQKSQDLVHLVSEKVVWTTDSGNVWMTEIANVLCANYMCAAAWQTPRGTRTHKLVITGIGEDAELCRTVVEYAVGFMLNAIKVLQRKNYHIDPKSVAKSYAEGFVVGLQIAFEEQQDQHPEWGLVVVKPEKVKKYEEGLGSKNVRTKKTDFDPLAYMKGQLDGSKFDSKRVLGDGQEA